MTTAFQVTVLQGQPNERPACTPCQDARTAHGLDPDRGRRAVFEIAADGRTRQTCDFHLIQALLQWDR